MCGTWVHPPPIPAAVRCRGAGHISAPEGEGVDPTMEQGLTAGREGDKREHEAAADTVAVALS